jgi:hypothetical protein
MKTNHYLILGGIALVAGYLWYKNREKNENDRKALETVKPTETTEEASNFIGTACRCDNGRTGFCQSGDCSRCCGKFGYKKMGRN